MVQTNFRTLHHGDHVSSGTIPAIGGTKPPALRTKYMGVGASLDNTGGLRHEAVSLNNLPEMVLAQLMQCICGSEIIFAPCG